MSSIAYPIKDSLYLNITNRCTNQCGFCIRNMARQFNGEHDLWLDREPSVEEILKAIGDPARYKQIVFCGYGEPLVRLEDVKKVAKRLKFQQPASNDELNTKGQIPNIRIDTNGQANLYWGRNILPELKGLIDHLSISLDAQNAEIYQKLCQPSFGEAAYPAVIEFIKEAVKYIPIVEASVVDLPEVDKSACKKIAVSLGAKFRIRPYYEEKYLR